MKIRDIILSALSNLKRSKGRTALTIIAIVIGAFTIALTTGINIGVNDYIDKQISGVGGERQLTISALPEQNETNQDGPMPYEEGKNNGNLFEPEYLTDQDIRTLKKIPGMTKVSPMSYPSTDYIKGANAQKYLFSSAPTLESLSLDMNQGRQASNDTSDYEISLALEYVKALGYTSSKEAIGQTVELGVSSPATEKQIVIKAKVVGVINESLMQGGLSTINMALSDELLAINQEGMPDSVKNQYMYVAAEMEGDLSPASTTKLKERLEDKGYLGATLDDEIGMIRNVINAITGVLTMFGAIALLAASFGIINTLYMSVQERTREIGLMKAMGLSGSKIFSMFSFEATIIGLLGSLIGIGLAVLVGSIINQIAADSFLSNLSGLTLIQFSLPTSGVIILIISGIAFLSGTLPASRAAKQDPIEALRYE